jgi:hypothetical protein
LKLLTIEPSRITVLGAMTNKSGMHYNPAMIAKVVQKYQFVGYPSIEIMLSGGNSELKIGNFRGYQIDKIEIYQDGFVIQSRLNSSTVDDFIDEFLEFVDSEFGTSLEIVNSINRSYQSTLTFESTRNILAPLDAMANLAGKISSSLKKATGLNVPFLASGIALASDEALVASMKPSAFKLERRVGIEFKFNNYFSVAPLRTNDHVELLEAWEGLV